MRVPLLFVALSSMAFVAGCTTYKDQLGRGERAFEQSDNDRAIAILRNIEPDFQRLTPTEQADYAYVRGMADYNVGYKADARHWLAVARGVDEATPGAMPAERKTKTISALNELNTIVFTEGNTANLVNTRKEPPPPAADPDAKPEKAEKAAPSKAKPRADEDEAPADKPADKPAEPEKPAKKPAAPAKK